MVAAQIHDADDRPEPRQHVGYRHLRTETVRWMKCARSNHKEKQMRNAGVHKRCLQPAERLSSIFGRRSRLSPKVQRNNFLLLSNPLTTAIGPWLKTAALQRFVWSLGFCGRDMLAASLLALDPFRQISRIICRTSQWVRR
jgi:hypothetical protein